MNDVKSLSHNKWRCKYHIVFAPKYRRQVIYNQIKVYIGKILRGLCERKGVEILEAECCPDHIHMLVTIPPHMSVSEFMGYLKSKSSLMVFDRHANLKYKYGNRHFWCRGYYVDTVGKYENAGSMVNVTECLRTCAPRKRLITQAVGHLSAEIPPHFLKVLRPARRSAAGAERVLISACSTKVCLGASYGGVQIFRNI